MSQLGDTQRAHAAINRLIDQAVLNKNTNAVKELERFRVTLDVAFYLLGWSQFEFLVRKESSQVIEEKAAGKGVERHAWRYMKENVKAVTVRNRLELIFNADQTVLDGLHKDYDLRNEIAHNYKKLPAEVRDIDDWLAHLEELVSKFELR